MKTPSRLQKVINGLVSRGVDFSTATEYGEPGYSTDKEIILFANWNDFDKSEMNAIESVAEIEWSDEWMTDDKGRAFRSSPDSYGWTQAWFLHEGEVVPFDSFDNLEGEALLDTLAGYGFTAERGDVELKALPASLTTEQLESVAVLISDDNQTGFHPGQDASPSKMLKTLPDGKYLFRISDKGQFDVTWEVWQVKDSE